MKIIFALIAFVVLIQAAVPPPKISPSYTATVYTYITNGTHSFHYVDNMHVDRPAKKERFDRLLGQEDVETLLRYDTGYSYEVHAARGGAATCSSVKASGEIPDLFWWLPNATVAGSCSVEGKRGQLWQAKFVEHEISGCFAENTPLEVKIEDKNEKSSTVNTFDAFVPGPVPADRFEVPRACTTMGPIKSPHFVNPFAGVGCSSGQHACAAGGCCANNAHCCALGDCCPNGDHCALDGCKK